MRQPTWRGNPQLTTCWRSNAEFFLKISFMCRHPAGWWRLTGNGRPDRHSFSKPEPRSSSRYSGRHTARKAAGRRGGAGRSSPGSPSCGESRPPRCAGQARRGRRHSHAQPSPWTLAGGPHRDYKRRGRVARPRAAAFRWQPERRVRDAPRTQGPPTSSLTSAKPHRASTSLLHPLPQLPGCHLTLQPPSAGRGSTLRPLSRLGLRQHGRSLTRRRV